MMNKNIVSFIGCDSSYDEASIVLFGAPFDGTTTFRPGTRFGPSAMRNESFGMESYSPYSDKDLEEYCIYDGGDIELPFGNTEKALSMIEEYTDKIVVDNKIPVMFGGEHLVTLGAFRAVVKKYPDIHVIHFDAHTDLRDEYMGYELSHSTVIKQVWKLIGDGRIHQFGIRSGLKEEFEFAKEHTNMNRFDLNNFKEAIEQLKGKPIYFTLDLDVLDPSIFCGTGTPEAGGVSFKELLDAVLLLKELNVVACDINELSPHYDTSGASTMVACKIAREIILQIAK